MMVGTRDTPVSAAEDSTPLSEAVKSDNHETIRSLLNARVDVNAPDADGTTPLHWAVRVGDDETVKLLLSAGARANATNRYGVTPLSVAAINGRAALIDMLLSAGADPNSASPDGETALMTAARTGEPQALSVLLAHGADANARERWQGQTPLMWAAAENHAEAVKLLLAHGAEIDARSKRLEFPKFNFNGSTMVSTPMPRGALTPLMFASRQGALEAVRTLIDAGASLNLTDPDGTTALVMSISNRHYDVAAFLAERKADPNIPDTSGMAALYAAVDLHTAGLLINRPSPKPTGSIDALGLATILLDHGADPNARLRTPTLQWFHNGGDPLLTDGATPLMRAAKSADVAAMRLLLDHGANPNLPTRNFTTALMFAAGLGASRTRSEDAALEAVTLCLDRGADVNAFNSNGLTALHIAVERSDRLVRLLAERGAELDLKDRDGRTPLDIALGVSASTFQGRRGAAPAVRRDTTAALLRQLMAGEPASEAPPLRTP
jgi:ankyrin repeat protein